MKSYSFESRRIAQEVHSFDPNSKLGSRISKDGAPILFVCLLDLIFKWLREHVPLLSRYQRVEAVGQSIYNIIACYPIGIPRRDSLRNEGTNDVERVDLRERCRLLPLVDPSARITAFLPRKSRLWLARRSPKNPIWTDCVALLTRQTKSWCVLTINRRRRGVARYVRTAHSLFA
jgi:hypothetical protein